MDNKIMGFDKKTIVGGSIILIVIAVVLTLYFTGQFESLKTDIQQFTDLSNTDQNKIVDNILKNTNQELDTIVNDRQMSISNDWENPLVQNINQDRNNIAGVSALQSLIREVNIGNDIPGNSELAKLYRQKARGINSSKVYSPVSYKNSNNRMDWNGDGISQESQEQLDKMYNDSVVFNDSEYQNNSNYTGMPSNMDGEIFSTANLANFSTGPQTSEERVATLYNSNNYLPNASLTNPALEKGFQILENPVSVSNPNLIPVLKAMPVSSLLGSKRNSSQDLRGDPGSNPKTVVSPFLNSSIMPDIYAANRGCI